MIRSLKNTYHLAKSVAANLTHGFPSRKMQVIGITGTDGKTTTASLIYHILTEAGEKAAMITTVGAYIGGKQYDTGFHVTTPSSFTLQRYIKKAKRDGVKYLVLETTSHALDQNRVWGVNFKIGVLTNITREHLDYHQTFEKYLKTKLKLLQKSKACILNMDDKSFELVKKALRKKRIFTFSLNNQKADYNPGKFKFSSPLIGDFNTSNCLAAIAVVKNLGLSEKSIKSALSSFKTPPGRQEIVYDKEFKVMVDFAHTPNSFVQILSDLKRTKRGRLIHVFGSAGKRDAGKRPFMGKTASKYDDIIILTAEDPRNEKVEKINEQIRTGISKEFKKPEAGNTWAGNTPDGGRTDSSGVDSGVTKLLFEIPDREEAIKFAISIAKKGDLVILTGKGHETSMNLGKNELPWSDKEVVLKYL